MPKTPDYFAGKTIIITGAGSGIGRATALIFARERANVVCADINEDAARATAEQVNGAGSQALDNRVSARFAHANTPVPSIHDLCRSTKRVRFFNVLFTNVDTSGTLTQRTVHPPARRMVWAGDRRPRRGAPASPPVHC